MIPRKWLFSYRLLSAGLRGEAKTRSARASASGSGLGALGQTQSAGGSPVEATPPKRVLTLTAGRKL